MRNIITVPIVSIALVFSIISICIGYMNSVNEYYSYRCKHPLTRGTKINLAYRLGCWLGEKE